MTNALHLQYKGYNYESYSFGVMPLFKSRMMSPDGRALVLHANRSQFDLCDYITALLNSNHALFYNKARKLNMKFSILTYS